MSREERTIDSLTQELTRMLNGAQSRVQGLEQRWVSLQKRAFQNFNSTSETFVKTEAGYNQSVDF